MWGKKSISKYIVPKYRHWSWTREMTFTKMTDVSTRIGTKLPNLVSWIGREFEDDCFCRFQFLWLWLHHDRMYIAYIFALFILHNKSVAPVYPCMQNCRSRHTHYTYTVHAFAFKRLSMNARARTWISTPKAVNHCSHTYIVCICTWVNLSEDFWVKNKSNDKLRISQFASQN